jgi:regulatory protein spx
MLKRIDFYAYPDDMGCEEVKAFLETQELDIHIRDLKVRPLGAEELTRLMRHFDTKHFVNISSKAFKKYHLDQEIPPRQDLIKIMAEDNDLIRKPIIVAGRLMTVGCNRQKIMEMLQIKSNGTGAPENGGESNSRDRDRSRDRERPRDNGKDRDARS